MKKIVFGMLLILMAFLLVACKESAADEKEDEEVKEKIDFPYCIELEIRSMQVLMREKLYNIVVYKTEDSVELTVKYNDEDYDYIPEALKEIKENEVYIMKYKDKVFDFYREEDKIGKEIVEVDFTPDFRHEEKINLSKEQYGEIADIIAKVQSYDYDIEEENRITGIVEFPYTEDVILSVKNTESGESKEIDCKKIYCEYYLIYDENVKELIKKASEFSPVPIVNWDGKPLELSK